MNRFQRNYRIAASIIAIILVYVAGHSLEAASHAASYHNHIRWDYVYYVQALICFFASILLIYSLLNNSK